MIDSHALLEHENYLREKVFRTNQWPQYELLLEDIRKLARQTKWNASVVSYERNIMYGGTSLFAPYFDKQRFSAVDMTPSQGRIRGAYNDVADSRRICIENEGITDKPSLIIIPNLYHHVEYINEFFWQVMNNLAHGGQIYIFEPCHREIHQAPEHFHMATPYAIQTLYRNHDISIVETRETGGPFTTMAYFYHQCLEYIPENEREAFGPPVQKMIERAKTLDKKYPKNLKRKYSRCPAAFSVLGVKS